MRESESLFPYAPRLGASLAAMATICVAIIFTIVTTIILLNVYFERQNRADRYFCDRIRAEQPAIPRK